MYRQVFAFCCIIVTACGTHKGSPSNPKKSPQTQTGGTASGAYIDGDLFVKTYDARVVPSPFNDCVVGEIEELSATTLSGWLIDICALKKGDAAQAGANGVVVYLDVETKGSQPPANSDAVAFVPAASKGVLSSPATPPSAYVIGLTEVNRKFVYQKKEYNGKFGFQLPLAQYVSKGKIIRIDGIASSIVSQLLAKQSHDQALYGSAAAMAFDFQQNEPLAKADLDYLKFIPQQKYPVSSTIVPVHMKVVQRSNGTGNELWEPKFIQAMLQRASDVGQGRFSFSLQSVSPIKDDAQYAMEQWPLLAHWNPKVDTRASGEIFAYVSHPTTADAVGLSWIQVLYTPIIIVRGRQDQYNSFEFLNNTALVFLHEMGHESNLNHSNGVDPLHTDAFDQPVWLEHVTKYYQELLKHKGEPPVCIMYDQNGEVKC